MPTRPLFCLLAMAWLAAATPARAQDAEEAAPTPIAVHMAHMLAGGGQWRTPNEDHDPDDPDSVSQFGANFRLSDDASHVIGEVTGVTPDGRVARYWTIYVFHNPVTGEVVHAQVGWNGAYMIGYDRLRDEALGFGESETVDQLVHEPNGRAHMIRHVLTPVDAHTHTTQTYERDEAGAWTPRNFRTWTLAPAD